MMQARNTDSQPPAPGPDSGVRTFDADHEYGAFLSQSLDLEDFEATSRDVLLKSIMRASMEYEEPRGARLDLQLRRWVIKDGDLALFSLLKTVMVGFASANFVLGGLSTSATVAVLVGGIELVRNVFRNGARLTEDQLSVVLVLTQHSEPLPFSSLLARLQETDNRWSEDVLRSQLSSLGKVPTRARLTRLVESTDADEWRLVDL